MPEYSDLRGRVVLVTGGGNGIGAATVRALHAQGASVSFCDRLAADGEKVARECPGSEFTQADLAREKEIIRWIEKAGKKAGRIDVLVNNAAVDPRIPLGKITAKNFEEIININVRAPLLAAREVAPRMPAEGGSIINVTSITFHTGPVDLSTYVASKGAVMGMTRSLARELGPRGIRVNTVSPGWVMTDRQLRDYVDAATKKRIRRSQCVPELLQPEEIAEVILFLASAASRAITGQEILADRGWAHS